MNAFIPEQYYTDEAAARFRSGCIFLNRFFYAHDLELKCVEGADGMNLRLKGSSPDKDAAMFAVLSWAVVAGMEVDKAVPDLFRSLYDKVTTDYSTFLSNLERAAVQAFGEWV